MNNTRLYVNRTEGFIGTSLKKDEFVTDCSDIDDVIIFRKDGKMMVTKVDAKTFVGKDIIHIAIFKKKDKRTVYNYIYRDGAKGPSYMKRFTVTGITRDKEYDLTNGNKGSEVHYFSANPNGEAEVVTINLRSFGSIKKLKWDIDFADLAIKGRDVRGNTLTKYAIKSIDFKSEGVSTLKPRKIWFDDTVQRLNVDERGELLGEFNAEDKLLIILQHGKIKAVKPDLAMHFEDDMIVLEKWKPNKPISAIYFDGDRERYYVKRFLIETTEKEELFISDHPKSQLEIVATDYKPFVEVIFSKRNLESLKVNLEEFITIKGIKAQGNQLTMEKIKQVNLLEPLPFEEPEEEPTEDVDVVDEEVIREVLPLEIDELKVVLPIEQELSTDEKANIALQKSIARKKAEQKKIDDEKQTKLF